jgi:REP element-mobilizing transposase RayT
MNELPKRKHLTRIPVWLPLDAPVIYFVTACCSNRRAVFGNAVSVRLAAESLQRIGTRLGWSVAKACFMPDHVHLLLSPMREREQSVSQFMQRWKTSVTLRLGRETWQREFFDRLLRSEEKLDEKWNYIRENPVRAGLCRRAEDYPYSGTPGEILEKMTRPQTPTARTLNDRDSRPTQEAVRASNNGDASPKRAGVGRARLSSRLPAECRGTQSTPTARTLNDRDSRPTQESGLSP